MDRQLNINVLILILSEMLFKKVPMNWRRSPWTLLFSQLYCVHASSKCNVSIATAQQFSWHGRMSGLCEITLDWLHAKKQSFKGNVCLFVLRTKGSLQSMSLFSTVHSVNRVIEIDSVLECQTQQLTVFKVYHFIEFHCI